MPHLSLAEMTEAYQEQLAALLTMLELETHLETPLQVKPFLAARLPTLMAVCLSLTRVGFALKLPETARQALLKEGAQPLRYFPETPIKEQYLLLTDSMLEDLEVLRYLVVESVSFVTTH